MNLVEKSHRIWNQKLKLRISEHHLDSLNIQSNKLIQKQK